MLSRYFTEVLIPFVIASAAVKKGYIEGLKAVLFWRSGETLGVRVDRGGH